MCLQYSPLNHQQQHQTVYTSDDVQGGIQLSQTTLGATLDTVWLWVHNQHILAALLLLQEYSRMNGKLCSQPLSTIYARVCLCCRVCIVSCDDRPRIYSMHEVVVVRSSAGELRGVHYARLPSILRATPRQNELSPPPPLNNNALSVNDNDKRME